MLQAAQAPHSPLSKPPYPTFQLPATIDSAALLERLAARWPVRTEPTSNIERVYLDTFDWRLYRAGGLLQAKRSERVLGLVWQNLSNRKPMASCRVTAVPHWPTDIPPGMLREAITPLLAMRVLLPMARLRATSRLLRILDDNDKTVVRLLLEQTVCLNDAGRSVGELPPHLTLVPVKGYDKAARKLAAFLAEELTLPASDHNPLQQALALQGRAPCDYSSALKVQLDPAMDVDTALRRILKHLLDTLQRNVAGARDDLDSEFLHDLRVATRRTRSVLGQVKGVLPAAVVADFRQRFAWLGQVSGETRDLDVFVLDFPRYRASLPEELRADLDPLLPYLQDHQRQAQQVLRRKLDSPHFRRLLKEWRALLDTPLDSASAGPKAALPVRQVAGARLWRSYRRVLAEGRAIHDTSPPAALHELRKRCKKLRYLLECFASLYPAKHIKPVIKQLKRLLDNLGEFQDQQVQADKLRAFGEDLQQADGDLPVVLAIGSLVGDLLRRQAAARTAFAARFAAFDDDAQHALCRRLFKREEMGA